MKDTDQDQKISTSNVESFVRAYGKELNPERKAALLSRLDNQQSVFIKMRMDQAEAKKLSQGRSHGRGRGC